MGIFDPSQKKVQERWLADLALREEQAQLAIRRREYERNELYRRELERERQLAEEAEIKQLNDEHEKLREQERVNDRMAALKDISPKSVRRLRELIRTRYQLDVEVWNLRNVQLADRKLVMEEGKKADATLQEIYSIVGTWEESAFTPQEWIVAKRVKELVFLPNKRVWEKNPPWE